MLSTKTLLRPRYADTDQMGIVHHAKYFEYFEIARTDLLRTAGLSYAEFEQMGFLLPLTDCYASFIIPILYDVLIRIETTLVEIHSAQLHLKYKVFRDSDNQLLSEGFTKHAFVRKETMKPIRPPKIYIDTLTNYFNQK
ncbi:MAG: acyl-CoA thioesterase [Ignavibacteria bacterium]|nr:acyl-CoA thioesterase [Ignavibacteria bacterium]